MNKRLSLMVICLVLIISAGYFVSGKLIQKAYYENITRFNTSKNFNIQLVSYKRGLFSSKTDLSLQVVRPNSGKLQGLTISQHISHGPIFAVDTNSGLSIKLGVCAVKTILNHEWQQQLASYTSQTQPISISTVIKFDQTGHSWLRLKANDQKPDSKHNLTWETVTGFIEHDINFTKYQGSVVAPNISYLENNSNIVISDSSFNFNSGSQQENYFNSNVVHIKSLTINKQKLNVLNFNNSSFKIDLSKDAQQNIGFRVVGNIGDSQLLDQKFAQQSALLQITNIKPSNLPDLSKYHRMSPKALIDFMQQLTAAKETNLQLELPKHFTEAFISIISFELYSESLIGKFDKRPEHTVRKDISQSINGLVQVALKQKLFIDRGNNYALNFDGVSESNKSA